jgi:hypothetical protein
MMAAGLLANAGGIRVVDGAVAVVVDPVSADLGKTRIDAILRIIAIVPPAVLVNVAVDIAVLCGTRDTGPIDAGIPHGADVPVIAFGI